MAMLQREIEPKGSKTNKIGHEEINIGKKEFSFSIRARSESSLVWYERPRTTSVSRGVAPAESPPPKLELAPPKPELKPPKPVEAAA